MKRYQGSLYRIVLLLLVPLFSATAQYSISIVATDGSVVDTLTIGTSPTATFGLDNTFGETELPPITPPGVFDVRCVDVSGRTGMGNGARTDMHPFLAPLQSDTFRISFRSGLSGGAVQFFWPSGLESLGAGRWRMIDVLTGGFLDIDMNAQTSVIIPASYIPDPILGGAVDIVVQDSAKFRTFIMDTLALDTDLKGKLKAEKKKGIASRWRFRFANATGQDVDGLVVKFSQAVTEHVSYSPFTSVQGENTKTITYRGPIIAPDEEFIIEGFGNKGKPVKAKAYWIFAEERVGDRFDPVTEDLQILYPMPNAHNLGEELFASGAFAPGGLVAGIPGSIRSVVHDKYRNLSKTLVKKGIVHTGSASCLDSLDSGKPFKKALTSLPPTIHNNRLLAEQVTLKFNIGASDAGRTPPGLGDLKMNDSLSPLHGLKIREIASLADTVLSCSTPASPSIALLTFDEWQGVLQNLNGAFSGSFDTAGWSTGLVLTGARFVSDVPFLTRDPSLVPPASFPIMNFVNDELPGTFMLMQNYPNPFNPSTTISFALNYPAIVTLTVSNVLGQTIAVLADREEFENGEAEFEFDGSSLSSGAYYYRIHAEAIDGSGRTETQMRKMLLMK